MVEQGVTIRMLKFGDQPKVLKTERLCFGEHAWTEKDFTTCLRTPNVIALVASRSGGKIDGHMVYALKRDRIDLLNLAVRPASQRERIGSMLIGTIKAKLTSERRRRISCVVRETNTTAQLFLRACGFRATQIARGCYEDVPEDGYYMEYRIESVQSLSLYRRISLFPLLTGLA
jgi:[ribosomal protein S18]-alanine N-acetyltransferase